MNTNSQLNTMSDQELRQYFAETRDELAYQEIIKRGPNAQDMEALEQFRQWQQEQSQAA
ncbi:MAG: hypothetical protein AAGD25_38160 [Cyanobacteria bacterium P01_F01_bin.150]